MAAPESHLNNTRLCAGRFGAARAASAGRGHFGATANQVGGVLAAGASRRRLAGRRRHEPQRAQAPPPPPPLRLGPARRLGRRGPGGQEAQDRA